MTEPLPDKPKGMHHDTYMRLFWEHHEAEWEHLAGAREWLDKLQKQVGWGSLFGILGSGSDGTATRTTKISIIRDESFLRIVLERGLPLFIQLPVETV